MIYTTVTFLRRTEGLFCKPQASSSVLRLVFSHVETRQCDCAAFSLAFIAQPYSYIIYQLEIYNYIRFIIHVRSCIYGPLCDHFVDKPFILI